MSDSDIFDPKVGSVINGRYKLEARLAAGGMGVVYKGHDDDEGDAVAVKFLHDAFAGHTDLVKRFQREVTAMRRLSHPNLIGIRDSGVSGGVPFLVMDFESGKALADILDRGALPPARAVGIARQVLAGVAHAHGSGVVHRDLKPDNILIIDHERVKILDFGLAKMVTEQGATQLTNTGFALGTPGYMAPEQARGGDTDERTDLYAIGVVLYHMVVGQKPFIADSPMAVLRMHMDDPPKPPRKEAEISKDLDAAILRALEKEPGKRWKSAEAFARALEETPEGRASHVPVEIRRRRRWGRPVAALVTIALLAGAGLYAWSYVAARRRAIERAANDAQRKLDTAVGMAKETLRALTPPPIDVSPSKPTPKIAEPAKPANNTENTNPGTEDEDDGEEEPAPSSDTPGAKLEAAAAEPPRRAPTLQDATRALNAGRVDDAIAALYQVRKQAPRSPAVALFLGHAYFRKNWRTDGLREYATALALKPALRRNPVLVKNAVAALDDPTSRLARSLIRKRIGAAALVELRRAARDSKNPKLQARAGHLAREVTPRRHKRR